MRKYKEDFLSKPRFVTDNLEKADNSKFIYSDLGNGKYGLALIGVINHYLGNLGLVLVANVYPDNNEIKNYKIVRRWW